MEASRLSHASELLRQLPRPARFIIAIVLVFGPPWLPSASAQVATTTRVSVGPGGVQGNGGSLEAAISADGRFISFASGSNNFVEGDTCCWDVFVRDRLTGATSRVSVSSSGAQGNNSSDLPAISADGRFVAFQSRANTLVSGDTNGQQDVFVHDRLLATTTRVSVASDGTQGDGESAAPRLSADGRYVVFTSSATNLVPGDTNSYPDVFVRDCVALTTTRVSVDSAGRESNGDSYIADISADGRFVAFDSDGNLVTGDTNGARDVFVHDRRTGSTTRVSVDSAGRQADYSSFVPTISADGQVVAFDSEATNLVIGDSNAQNDVFVHDRWSGATTRVSIGPGGAQGDEHSYIGVVSGNGRFVAFESAASNLVADKTTVWQDIYVHDRVTGVTTRASVGTGGAEATVHCFRAAISANGRFVLFDSADSGKLVPGDTNGMEDVFLRDRGRIGPPLPNDIDQDGRSDVLVFRPSNGTWYVVFSNTLTGGSVRWGVAGDVPVPADYDGDGKPDAAIYRPSTGIWYIMRSSTDTAIGIRWGQPGDLPAPADFDGDGKCDPTVFRPSNGVWYELRSGSGTGFGVSWGVAGDIPVPADYDGDGRADPTVFRPSTGIWYELRSLTGTGHGVLWGVAGDTPLAGDYDVDGRADPTVYRASTGTWYVLRSLTGTGSGVTWGAATDLPVIGDYDGDGKADPTVFRPSNGTWYELRSLSGNGFGIVWGTVGDIPR